MTGVGREGFPEAFCPSLEDECRYGHCHHPELQRSRIPGMQGRPSIKYIINRELGQVNTVRMGTLTFLMSGQEPGPWPCSQ